MRLHDRTDDGKAEAGTSPRPYPRLLGPVEALENTAQPLLAETGTVIGYDDLGTALPVRPTATSVAVPGGV